MKTIFAAAMSLAVLASTAAVAQADTISGVGATFPAPIYQKWAEGYKRASGNNVNYQPIGSGGGIKQIEAKTVDFGATDKPLTQDVLNQYGLFQFPTVIGGVVPMINVPGVPAGKLKLTGAVLADIYLGKITTWNNPAITKLNPGLPIPPLPITVVHRADGSGTSFLFTSYLSAKSPEWKAKVGANDAVQWPAGVGGKGNDGVSVMVKQTIGSIGFVEYAYIMKINANYALLQSHDGTWPQPTATSFAAAATSVDWTKAPGNYVLVLDQPGANAWPITGATFILVYKAQQNAARGAAVLKFFDYGYTNGDADALNQFFVTLPPAVKKLMRKEWADNVKANGKPVYVSPIK